MRFAGFITLLHLFPAPSGRTGITNSEGTLQKNSRPPTVSASVSPTFAPVLEGAPHNLNQPRALKALRE